MLDIFVTAFPLVTNILQLPKRIIYFLGNGNFVKNHQKIKNFMAFLCFWIFLAILGFCVSDFNFFVSDFNFALRSKNPNFAEFGVL